jgi:hypothetical protein
MQWVDAGTMTDRLELSREYRIYRRGHRSAQKHIEQVAWFFEDCAAEWGCLPQGERAAIGFDARMNSQIRNTKDRKDYFRPDEEMLAHWLRQYCGAEDLGVQAAVERRREAEREMRAFEEGARIN